MKKSRVSFSFLSFVVFSLAFLYVTRVTAQVGRVGINTTNPMAMLHVMDSSVVFSKNPTLIPGPPPISGPGTRMMWYANKASFRAGQVWGPHWNKDSVGYYSCAFGTNTIAKGSGSFACGSESKALSDYTIAMGVDALASDIGAVSIGYNTNAGGNRSIALGFESNALGDYSFACGYKNKASAKGCVALGYQSHASGEYSATLGYGTLAPGFISTATGLYTKASGKYALTAGYYTKANGFASTVIGFCNDTIVSPEQGIYPTTPLFIIGNGANESSRSNALVVRYDGKMGIGTDTPDNRLDIRSDGTADTAEIILGLISNTSNRPVIQFSETSTATPLSGMSIEYNGSGSSSENKLHFRGNDAVRRFTVMNNGRTGINTENPSHEMSILDIGANGDAILDLRTTDGSKELVLGVNSSAGALIGTQTGTNMTLRTSGTTRMTIAADGSYVSTSCPLLPTVDDSKDLGSAAFRWDEVWASNGVIQTSDERDKKDIVTIESGLDKILSLRPVSYRWKNSFNDDKRLGLIAQEVQSIIPEAVRSTNVIADESGHLSEINTERLGMNYSELIPLLIKAIQEQQKVIENLEARIQAFENQ